MAPAGQSRVGRPLAVLALLIVALYSVIFLRDLSPKLGLDLQGGTQVILTPRVEDGGAPDEDQLAQAVNIIRQRVNGLGVSEAEVVTQGTNIVINVPGEGRRTVQTLGSTAQLRFREVQQELPGTAGAAPPAAVEPAPSNAPASPGPASPAPAPATSPTANSRALGAGLLAQASPTPAPSGTAPSGTAPTAPAPTAPAPASTAPVPASADPGAPAATPPPSVTSGTPGDEAALATLDCTRPENRRGGSTDRPEDTIVACDREGAEKFLLAPAAVVGTDVADASAVLDSTAGSAWQVTVQFTGEGQDKFTQLTQTTTGRRVAIVLDGVVVSAPTIQSVIAGDAQITGQFSQAEARDLANVLKYGALPLTFDTSQAQSISPSLGGDQLRAGLLAGGIGLALVVVYSLLYYRALGLITIASLVVSGIVTYAAVVVLGETAGFALTLAGIAGFIVAVGVTADSFIVYYERMRDEVREGRTLRSAAERGWTASRRTILSADFVSMLAAVVLYVVSVGNVRGFAFTLGLSTAIDILVVFLFTRPLVALASRSRALASGRFGGLGSVGDLARDNADRPSRGRGRRTAPAGGRPSIDREA